MNLIGNGEWEEIEVTVDSGACDTVIPLDVLSQVELSPSPQSEAGLKYEAASGHEIENVGERRCVVMADNGEQPC